MNRRMEDILDDTQKHMIYKDELEQNLRLKEKTGVSQINPKSDKVMHDRFDADFNNVCEDLDINVEDFTRINCE